MLRAFQRTIRRRHEPRGDTNCQRLERWLGADEVRRISEAFRLWYGPPVALGSVPGNVYVTASGQFIGPADLGAELTQIDMIEAIVRRERKRRFLRLAHSHRQAGAFANLQAVLDAANGGKRQNLPFTKQGSSVTTTGRSGDTWTSVGTPQAAGSAGAAAPGGTATTKSTTGALPFSNPSNANTMHFLGGYLQGVGALGNYMVVDQLFRVAKTMSSTTTEAVTGTFAHYQNASALAADYIGGNFCYPSVTATLGATAHNWTVCQYTNQAGTTAQNFGSLAGVSSSANRTIDAGAQAFFLTLASGDVGVKALTQMQCDASVTGSLDFVVSHPIAILCSVLADQAALIDCLTTAMSQLKNIYDDACLTFLSFLQPASSALTTAGNLIVVSE